ncbi:MAG: efflux RND transporter periplasmic adaptor subunit [Burkholderiales bacterium]|nr:efflux RND transporter periplasmic adaptor subunit [Burkholderiales bacterium]
MAIRSGRLIASLSAVTLLVACGKEAEKPEVLRPVQVVRVSAASSDLGASYIGDVRARYETALSFRLPGKIAMRMVDVGDRVKAGQVIARLDPADEQLGVEAAQQQLTAAESQYEQAKNDLARFKDLFEQGFVGSAEFERRTTTYKVAEAQLRQARANLGVNRNQSTYTTLRADHEGVVTSLAAEVGQVVTAGQLVAKVARPGDKEVVIAVSENRLSELRAAKEINVGLWADPNAVFKGRLREVAPSADPATRTYAAKVTILNPSPDVALGMTAGVFLKGVPQEQSVRLPSTALFQKDDQPAVWVMDPKTATVQLRPVKIGRYFDDAVTVTEGLQPGDVVVRAGVHKLFAGEKVRVMGEAAP